MNYESIPECILELIYERFDNICIVNNGGKLYIMYQNYKVELTCIIKGMKNNIINYIDKINKILTNNRYSIGNSEPIDDFIKTIF